MSSIPVSGVSLLSCPPRLGKAEKEGRREGWGEGLCEEEVMFARVTSERPTPVFKKLLAFSTRSGSALAPLTSLGGMA